MGEVRYSSLTRTFPKSAELLFKKAEVDMKERYETYKQMAGGSRRLNRGMNICHLSESSVSGQVNQRCQLTTLLLVVKNSKFNAPVAQLDRAPGFEPVGRRFESCRARSE